MNIIPNQHRGFTIDLKPKEIWTETKPKKADHIRVSRGLWYHHGVYISDDEVIHFTGYDDDNILDFSNNEVIKTDLANFLRMGTLEVKKYTEEEQDDVYPVEHIVHYARGCLGDVGYNLIINNCEHFANMCTLGRFRSRQVERFFENIIGGNLPGKRRDDDMGWLGDVWNAIWGNGGGGRTSTSSTYTYEPDKVKIAEIEAETRLKLADKEAVRIELWKNARLEILEFEVRSNCALEEAKAHGLTCMVEVILVMQDKLNEIAKKRLTIIEEGSLEIIRDIEEFYGVLKEKIIADNEIYRKEKLPQMLLLLESYQPGTASYDLYYKSIEDDMKRQTEYNNTQLNSVENRQCQIITGFFQSKDRILEQTGQTTSKILENIASAYMPTNRIESKSYGQPLLEEKKTKMIEEAKELEKTAKE